MTSKELARLSHDVHKMSCLLVGTRFVIYLHPNGGINIFVGKEGTKYEGNGRVFMEFYKERYEDYDGCDLSFLDGAEMPRFIEKRDESFEKRGSAFRLSTSAMFLAGNSRLQQILEQYKDDMEDPTDLKHEIWEFLTDEEAEELYGYYACVLFDMNLYVDEDFFENEAEKFLSGKEGYEPLVL